MVNYMYGEIIETTLAEVVEVPKADYDRLKDESEWLDALIAAGVDNWDGIDLAQEIYDTFKSR